MGTSFKLQNGLLLLSTEAPGGVYNAEQLKKLAALCDGEDAVAKATEDQRLALFVPPNKAAAVAAQLKSVGLGVRHYQDGLHQPINCLGALCGEHLQDAMGTSMDLADELAGLVVDQPLKIGINGCARCCLATHTLDISIIGDTGGYRVSLGGKNSQLPEMASFMAEGVPAAKLPKLIAKVVSVYKELAQPGESLQEVMERAGTQKFIATLAPYSQDAASDPFSGSVGELSADAGLADIPTDEGDDLGASLAEDDLKIDDLPMGDGFAAPGIDAGISSEGIDAEPSFDDTDLSMSALDPGPEATGELDDTALALPDDIAPEELEALDPALDSAAEDSLSEGLDSLEESGAAAPLASEAEEEEAFDAGLAAEPIEDLPVAASDDDLEGLTLDSLPEDDLEEPITAAASSADELTAAEDLAVDDMNLDEIDLPEDDNAFAVDSLPAMAGDPDDEFAPETTSPAAPEVDMGEEALALGAEGLDSAVEPADDAGLEEESMMAAPAVAPAPAPKPVAATPAPAAAAPPFHAEDDMAADEIAEADADAFEEKLNASIAEEGALPEVEDLNSSDRLAAMELVTSGAGAEDEASAPELAADEELGEDLSLDDLDDLDDLDELDMTESDASSAALDPLDAATLSDEESLGSSLDDDPVVADDPDLDADPASLATPAKQVTPMANKEAPRAVPSTKTFEFTGLDITAEGKIALQFASGAALELDPRTMGLTTRRELKLAGKSVILLPRKGGINVEVDGVSIFVPSAQAAA